MREEQYEQGATTAILARPNIIIGKAELRRALIRKLQGLLKKKKNQPQTTGGISKNEFANQDDKGAARLVQKDFDTPALLEIWKAYSSFIREDLTLERNEFVHRMGIQDYFAANILRAQFDHDEEYHGYAEKYRFTFELTYGTTLEAAPARTQPLAEVRSNSRSKLPSRATYSQISSMQTPAGRPYITSTHTSLAYV
ncbi:hypothetical protein LTR08_004815 [Meristemomyces frigidus]|nr:hypothetical protein LTR08_004815 [Meristemomyces frigidus]